MLLTKQEKQSLHRAYTYHAQCEMWYVAEAAKHEGKPYHAKIMANAEYHHRKADYFQKQLAAVAV